MYTYNILIVEDDKQIADAIEIYMKNQNYGVFKAYNGQLAIEIFEKEVIHLIIMDVMMPVMGQSILESIRLLSTGVKNFAEKCVDGIEANKERLESLAEASIATCTALAPIIGYDRSAELAKIAFKTGKSLRQVAKEEKVLPDEELDRVLDLMSMTRPGL